jgi:RNA polymerase sigma factor (sigma-70 family)
MTELPTGLPTLKQRALEAEDDTELLARYQHHGDHEALAILRSRHIADLEQYAARQVGDASRSVIADIIQAVFLRFHILSKRLPPKTAARALLFHMVGNQCAKHRKYLEAAKRDYRRTFPLREADINHKMDRRQTAKMEVNDLLATLPHDEAEAVRLVWIERHTAESAAELLGVSSRTVERRIAAAFARLREDATTETP